MSLEPQIGVTLRVSVPLAAELMDLGYTDIRVYWATSEAGSYSLVTTIPLVSTTFVYEYNNTTGLATDWAYIAYFGAGPSEGPPSPPQPVSKPRSTRKVIRQGVLARLQLGKVVVVASASSSTKFIASSLIDPDASAQKYTSWFARAATGAQAGESRRVRTAANTGYAPATGEITVNRAYGGALATAVEVELWKPHGDDDPSVIVDEAMQEARQNLWYDEEFLISALANQSEYTLPDGCNELTIRAVEWATDDYPDRPGWVEVPVWHENLGVISLSRTTGPWGGWSTGEVIRVRYAALVDRMDTEADYWDANLEWAIGETALAYLDRIAKPDGKEAAIDYDRKRGQVLREVQRWRQIYMPRARVKVVLAR